MEKNKNHGKQQKPQTNRVVERITTNGSGKDEGPLDNGGFERIRKGNAGDTENTGPRKKE